MSDLCICCWTCQTIRNIRIDFLSRWKSSRYARGDDIVKLCDTRNFKSPIAKALIIDNNITILKHKRHVFARQQVHPHRSILSSRPTRFAYSPRLYLPVRHPNHSHGHPRPLEYKNNPTRHYIYTCTHKGEIHVLYCIWPSIIEITSIQSHSSSARTQVQF